MAVVNINLTCELQEAVKVQYIDGVLFSQDNQANKINVTVLDGGQPATLSGTVSANIVCSDGGTVAASGGSITGNVASITLPAAAYAVPGVVSIVVKLTASGVITTIAAFVANMYRASTDTAIDPGTVIPSIQTLISQINAAVASIPADYSSLWTKLAPAFSTDASYVAGQYVTYNSGLYRFNTTHTGGWSSSDVTAVNLGGEITDLKSALYGQTSGYQEQTFTGKYIPYDMDFHVGNLNPATGEYSDNTSYRIASKRAIKVSKQLTLQIADDFRVMLVKENGSAVTPQWKTGTAAIPANQATKLIIARVTEDTSETADVAAFMSKVTFPDDMVTIISAGLYGQNRSYQEQTFTGAYIPYEMDFQNGNLDPSTGEFVNTLKYRVSSRRSIKVSKQLVLTIASGFSVMAVKKGVSSWSGSWETGTATIPANTETKIMIKRTTEDVSEIADIDTFISKITWSDTYNQTDHKVIENNRDDITDVKYDIGNIMDCDGTESNGFLDNTSSSTFHESANFKTIMVDVANIKAKYFYSGVVYNVSTVSGVIFFDANNKVIGHILDGSSSSKTYTLEPVGDIPEGTVKIAFVGYVGGGASVSAKELTVKSVYEEKDFVITGDSIETESAGKWPAMLKRRFPFKSYTNKAEGGTCMAHYAGDGGRYIASDTRVNAMPETADIVLVGGGTNDWGNNIPLGDLSDLSSENNFAGAVYSLITKLQTKYPNALIVFTSNQNTCSPNRHNFEDQTGWKNNQNMTAADYADMMEKVCKYAAVPYIDTNHLCGINRLNYTSLLLEETNYYEDTVYMHPNDSGAVRMFRVISNWFKNNAPTE